MTRKLTILLLAAIIGLSQPVYAPGARTGERAEQGPILAPLLVDSGWDGASANAGKVDTFDPATVRGGHAVAIVGYRTDGRFIVRNSWDTTWGDQGFAYVKPSYVRKAFFAESYGVSL